MAGELPILIRRRQTHVTQLRPGNNMFVTQVIHGNISWLSRYQKGDLALSQPALYGPVACGFRKNFTTRVQVIFECTFNKVEGCDTRRGLGVEEETGEPRQGCFGSLEML